MKKSINTFLLLVVAIALAACGKDENNPIPGEMVRMEGIEAAIGESDVESGALTRSVDDFAVNTANDPTHSMAFRIGWHFDLQIYNGTTPFATYGAGSLTWNTSSNMWIPTGNIYFPNYTKQKITVDIYPDTKDATVVEDQRVEDDFRKQDILEQNGSNYQVNPAHILQNVAVHHKRSMLDIILREVDYTEIAEVKVVAGGVTYFPYKIPGSVTFTNTEFLLILPVGIKDPQIYVTTREGARYVETLEITTATNVCFCVNLLGLELQLGNVTISDWTYGRALSGSYSVVTSYPTFKGPANSDATVTYKNGQTQTLIFNSRGEATVKPAGRTILVVNTTTLTTPIVLRSMLIDLNPYLT